MESGEEPANPYQAPKSPPREAKRELRVPLWRASTFGFLVCAWAVALGGFIVAGLIILVVGG